MAYIVLPHWWIVSLSLHAYGLFQPLKGPIKSVSGCHLKCVKLNDVRHSSPRPFYYGDFLASFVGHRNAKWRFPDTKKKHLAMLNVLRVQCSCVVIANFYAIICSLFLFCRQANLFCELFNFYYATRILYICVTFNVYIVKLDYTSTHFHVATLLIQMP